MKTHCITSIFLLISSPLLASECVLPSAGANIEPSNASYGGVISAVSENLIVLQRSNFGVKTNAHIGQKTKLLTVDNLAIGQSYLQPGQNAYVWYQGCAKAGQHGQPVAAIVICPLGHRCMGPP